MNNFFKNATQYSNTIDNAVQANTHIGSPSQPGRGEDNSIREMAGISYEQSLSLRDLTSILHEKLLGDEQKCCNPENCMDGLIGVMRVTIQQNESIIEHLRYLLTLI